LVNPFAGVLGCKEFLPSSHLRVETLRLFLRERILFDQSDKLIPYVESFYALCICKRKRINYLE
jgi:hypothetical protein